MEDRQVTEALRQSNVALSVQNLVKIYPGSSRPAVDDLTFSVATGEAFGFLGPNGAGKTTAISMMSSLMKPNSGEITLCGIDALRQPSKVKRMIGYVPQRIALYPRMSARENLRFLGRVYGLGGKVLEERIDESLEFVGLEDSADQRVAAYSEGMKRRANLAAGILHEPRVLFLDEPTVGIDPQSRNYILERLAAMAGSTTLVYTTHYINEVEQLCKRIAIMDRGRIVAIGSLLEIFEHAPESQNLEEVFISLTGRQLRD
jgi:ABC-2 type transport system ATP-binding protein